MSLRNIFSYSEDSPLLFTQFFFWAFFAIVLFYYDFVYKKQRPKTTYLLIVSLFFYYKSSGFYFFLLLLSTLSDFILAKKIDASKSRHNRRLFLTISIIINLSLLGYFKYTYFIVDILNNTFNSNLEAFNIVAALKNIFTESKSDISIIFLPVGISFYTFQTISYSVDVYKKKLQPLTNIIDFGFYVSFFPQLVAGPIVRAAGFIPQIKKKYNVSIDEANYSAFLIINGLTKKMLISDYLSINFVDNIFKTPEAYSGFENLLSVYAYAIQIYCDFSGYTDIAIGVALLLGFRLPINFNSPYKASSITDFWKRWHISLSTWLRDYLYIPLGGNRKGKVRTYINLLITMLLGGLWHGANGRFIIWGAIHGLGLIAHKVWSKFSPFKHIKNTKIKSIGRLISIIITYHFVCFAWLFFRADGTKTAFKMIELIVNMEYSIIPNILRSYSMVITIMTIGYFIHFLPKNIKNIYKGIFMNLPLLIKTSLIVLIIVIIYQTKSTNVQPFIYFQF